ncbi:MAG: Gfo/Idh/MocA family oxidoreductase [Cytophagales bacterium]|nr:Gfo/Idh/MocA family oxidoreductase [Bernardetiaceae bacterium]MDW8211204.1 Gfo/Idh/MocA family oxidoreductase [Cytophagales bacterium]
METTQKEDELIDRRSFIKTSAIVSAGVAVVGMPFGAYARYQDDTIKVALVGCGSRGTGAAAQALSVKPRTKLVAMADAFADRIEESYKALTANKFKDWSGVEVSVAHKVEVPPERRFVGFDAYQKAIELADVVLLATPPGFRPQHFEACIKAGKHVFMEKPVATDAPGVRQVLQAAELAKQKKLNVVVGLQRRYDVSYQELIKRLQGGQIGEIIAGQVYWHSDGVWVVERQPHWTEMEYQMRNWYYFNWLCGDHIVEQHIHNIDVFNWAKNAYPIRAQGMGGRQVRTGKQFGEIFDHHYVEFEYADGTILNSQCRHMPGTMSRVSETLIGTKGRATTHDGRVITDLKGKTIWNYQRKGNEPNPYQLEIDLLFEAVAKGDFRFQDAEFGAKSTLTAIMGRMATYSGQVVTWQEALHSNLNLMPERLAWDALPKSLPDAEGFYPIAIPGKTKAL